MRIEEALRRAVELAERGRFRVEPNPPVGCVLLRGGRVVGEGFHAAWGGPHAEVEALRRGGVRARGATACVTLEPCAHRGKTPPCADALIRAGVREVVYAHADPNPRTAGRGPRVLREAGISVRKARAPARLRALLRPYLEHYARRRPWVIAKWAMTLDGKIAARGGNSRWITGESARGWAHATLRAHADAIVVGARTVRTDDPSLDDRSGGRRPLRPPLRVVVCGRRPLPPRARVLRDGGPTLLAAPEGFRAPRGADVLRCGRNGRVDPRGLLRGLHERGVGRVLVEGGGDLLGAFFDSGLVDQVAVFVAPRVVGGVGAAPAVGGRGRGRIADAWTLEEASRTLLGDDWLIEGYVSRR